MSLWDSHLMYEITNAHIHTYTPTNINTHTYEHSHTHMHTLTRTYTRASINKKQHFEIHLPHFSYKFDVSPKNSLQYEVILKWSSVCVCAWMCVDVCVYVSVYVSVCFYVCLVPFLCVYTNLNIMWVPETHYSTLCQFCWNAKKKLYKNRNKKI